MARTRVVVGMSGGVDSSVAAALLREQGYDVIGIHFKVPSPANSCASRTCCGTAGLEDARRVADQLAIPFYALGTEEVFERHVIRPFLESYIRGETPNPCVECNRWIKFGHLLDVAKAAGAKYVATGHYARLWGQPPHLQKGVDPDREQSYFLYSLTSGQLSHAMFPLGTMTKTDVRRLARSFGLKTAEKRGSQDICFLGDGDYRSLIAQRHPQALQEGPITDKGGRILGRHRGTAGFTIGQRKGLHLGGKTPLHVIAIHPGKSTVVVGPREALLQKSCMVGHVNWIASEPPVGPLEASVKVRYRQPEQSASLFPFRDGRVEIRFHFPQVAAAPGQSAVFYQGDIVIGGGIIMAEEAV